MFVEYDRTRRVDKNYDKFRRYEAFLAGGGAQRSTRAEPYVVFVCQDDEHVSRFLDAADYELTGHLDLGSTYNRESVRRPRTASLFALEHDMHAGRLDALALPALPPSHDNRDEHPACARRPHGRPRDRAETGGSLSAVDPSELFRPSVGPLRADTRPDPPTPEIPRPAWTREEGGSTASRWTPLPRPAR